MLPRVRMAMHEYLGGYLPPLRDIASLDSYLRAPALGTHSGIRGAILLASGIAACLYVQIDGGLMIIRTRILLLGSLLLLWSVALPALAATPCAR